MASLSRVGTVYRAAAVVLIVFFVSLMFLTWRIPASVEQFRTFEEQQFRNVTLVHRSALLAILVLSSPENHDRRDAIRNTWLKYLSNDDAFIYFVVGTRGLSNFSALNHESAKYGDLIRLVDHEDAYQTLTGKVLLSFVWISKNLKFAFVFKVDDDTFARVDIILEELRHRSTRKPLYWGFFDGRAQIKKKGRWAEQKWVLCDRYLPHARGGGYILSASLVDYIVRSKDLLQQFNSEDVSIGAWLAPLDIERLHDPRFDTEHVSRGCSDAYIVTHKQNVTAMFTKHDNLINMGRLCGLGGQFKKRNSYIYDWSVLPSSCCIRNDSSVP